MCSACARCAKQCRMTGVQLLETRSWGLNVNSQLGREHMPLEVAKSLARNYVLGLSQVGETLNDDGGDATRQ